jgi:hypothetical protein
MAVTTIPIHPAGKDNYNHLWHKTRLIFQSLAESIWDRDNSDKLDFVAMADDDTYFIMDNLRAYLASDSIMEEQVKGRPVLIGDVWAATRFAPSMNLWVNGGGYVFNRVTAQEVNSCSKRLRDDTMIPEDVMVASCLTQNSWKFDLRKEGNACDASGRKMFSQENPLYEHADQDHKVAKMTRFLIEFHHTTGEDRYRFHQKLYKGTGERICAEAQPEELSQVRRAINGNPSRPGAMVMHDKNHPGFASLMTDASSLQQRDDGNEHPVPCSANKVVK